MINTKITDTAKISFDNFINVNELLNMHDTSELSVVDINIGYDRKIYILLSSNIPERINGMFINTLANTDYSILELSVDWESGTLINLLFLTENIKITKNLFMPLLLIKKLEYLNYSNLHIKTRKLSVRYANFEVHW